MNENQTHTNGETASEPTNATEPQKPGRTPFVKRRVVVSTVSAVAVAAVGISGYTLHQHGVQAGQARANHVAMTEWEALQARGDARVEAAKREQRLPTYMRVGAGVTAAEGKLFGWTDPASGCRFIRTPEGAIHWDVGPMDLREVTGELPTKGCRKSAPTAGRARRMPGTGAVGVR